MVRTSITHPLHIDDLAIGNGRLGITFCPGKKGESVFGAAWDRDIDLDLDAVKGWGASAVLSLVEDHEFGILDGTDALRVSNFSPATVTRPL